jgi:sigma-54 specific flagellar transcriptional regulator A
MLCVRFVSIVGQVMVRELANLVERLSILYPSSVIGLNELPEKFRHLQVEDSIESLSTPMVLSQSAEHFTVSLNEAPILPVEGVDLKEYLTRLERSLIQQAFGR